MRLSLQKEFVLCLSFPLNCCLGETFWERQPVTDGRLAIKRWVWTGKANNSLYKPGQALRVPDGRGTKIPRPLAHEGGNVVSPRHGHLYPTGNIPCKHVCCGTQWCSWLRHALQAGKSGGRFPLGSLGLLFHFRPHYDPEFDSASNRN